MPERRCAEHGCTTFPDAAWSYCANHMAEQEARGAAWAAGVAAPREAEIRSCVDTMPDILSPDCRDGKCAACTGDAWNNQTDEPTPCECACHDTKELPGG